MKQSIRALIAMYTYSMLTAPSCDGCYPDRACSPVAVSGACSHAFDKMKGVTSTLVGYSGGEAKTATYEQVSTGTTGHYESHPGDV